MTGEECSRQSIQDHLRTGKGGLEGVAELHVAEDTGSLFARSSEQNGKQVSTGSFDDRIRHRVWIRRMRVDHISTHGNHERWAVNSDEKPRALEVAVELTVVRSSNVQPPQSGWQCRSNEEIAPIVQLKPKIGAMDLNLGEPQERQTGEPNRSKVGVVIWFDDVSVPPVGIENVPDFIELPAPSAERGDDLSGFFSRPWFKRVGALCCTTTRVKEMAGNGEPAPARKQRRLEQGLVAQIRQGVSNTCGPVDGRVHDAADRLCR